MEPTLKSKDQAQENKNTNTNERPSVTNICNEEVIPGVSNSFWHINKSMLPFKMHFFLFMGGLGAILPFQPAIGITRLGLGAGNLTVVYTTNQFLFIVLKPMIGYITDYFNNLKGMIVTLTVINVVLSYLLLVIPRVNEIQVSHVNESFSEFPAEETKFCLLCGDLNQLLEAMEILPKIYDIQQSGYWCEKENLVNHVFNSRCVMDGTSSTPFNRTYKLIFEICSKPHNTSAEKSDANFEMPDNNSDYTIYLTVIPNWLPQLSIVCPKAKHPLTVENFLFTPSFILKSCYLNPQQHLFTNSTAVEKDILCPESRSKKDNNLENFRENSYKTYQFWIYALLIITSGVCTSSIFTLSDTACYESIQETGAEYGKQRSWGAIARGIMAPLSGFLNDYTDSYLAAMILMAVLCALQIWNLYKMDLAKPQNSQNILKDIRIVLGSAEFIAFSFGVFFNGMGLGIVWFFLAWFIIDIGGTGLLLGLAYTVQCFLGEVPFMTLSGWLLKKIGHFNVVSLALLCHSVRFLAYSSLGNPWHILPIECLDGITFGAFYAAMTSYGKLKSKPGAEATTQSFLCSVCEGLGAGLGCVIAGVYFDRYGGYQTFFYSGVCFALAAAINITSTVVLSFKKGSLV